MSALVLIDTSVFLNVLDVPSFNQDRKAVFDDFELSIRNRDALLLPLSVVWEAGNHIAKLTTGHNRRVFGKKLVDMVRQAVDVDAPFTPTHFPDKEEFLAWLVDFPEWVMRGKSERQGREGLSLVDFSIIKEWQKCCDQTHLGESESGLSSPT